MRRSNCYKRICSLRVTLQGQWGRYPSAVSTYTENEDVFQTQSTEVRKSIRDIMFTTIDVHCLYMTVPAESLKHIISIWIWMDIVTGVQSYIELTCVFLKSVATFVVVSPSAWHQYALWLLEKGHVLWREYEQFIYGFLVLKKENTKITSMIANHKGTRE